MPLIKRDPTPEAASRPPSRDDTALHLAELKSSNPDDRWRAARALAGTADAVESLAAALQTEPVARVREAIMTALIRSGGDAGIRALLSCMRSQDAAMRTAAIDALRAAPKAVHPFMQLVLQDDDADIRILATELVRNMAPAEATNILVGLLEKEQHPNVCAAAVEVIAEVGTAAAVPALRDCAARFADTPFLPFAISTAIARISEAESR